MMRYRPQLHFTPPHGWMNDPNGLVHYDGWWHLFYQHFPDALTHGPMHWGHATSRDLITWEHLPIALAPDELGNIWSGSAVVSDQGLLACFTHQNEQRQAQSYARSTDNGRTFVKDAANPILTYENPDFRDPKLFRHDGEWRMIVAAGPHAQLYGSSDLADWQLLAEIAAPEDGWLWECPDLFELNGIWVLIGSFIIPGRPHETYYWLGNFEGQSYTPTSGPTRLSFGPDDYAAVSWNDAPHDRRVLLGWMSRWDYAALTPTTTDGFRGAMTLPRELTLHEGQLQQNPPRELAVYRRSAISLDGWEAGEAITPQDTTFEIEANIRLGDAPDCGFILHTGDGESTVVGYDVAKQELFIDRTRSGHVDFARHFAGRFSTPLVMTGEVLSLRLVVDACSVELFADGGLIYGAALIFPTSRQYCVEFFGSEAVVLNGQLFEF